MDLINNIIKILGVAGTIGGLFSAWNGWETYLLGKKNENPQEQDRGWKGVVYGALMAVASAGVAAAISQQLSSVSF